MQATLVEDDEMVQTFPSDRANEAFIWRAIQESGESLGAAVKRPDF